jgi:YgiT-type zinc finger domain-containing protein
MENTVRKRKAMKVCNFCGRTSFKTKHVQYIYRHDDQFLVVNNVPCEECEFCGEQYFEAEALKKIEKEFNEIYQRGKKARKEVTVPIEEFVDITG